MDPKEQLRQVEEEMAKDEAEAKRLSRPDAAGGMHHQVQANAQPKDGFIGWRFSCCSSLQHWRSAEA